jgi:hypothetical protein
MCDLGDKHGSLADALSPIAVFGTIEAGGSDVSKAREEAIEAGVSGKIGGADTGSPKESG